MKRECKTPGAKYHTKIGPNIVECKGDIHFDLDLTSSQVHELGDRVHDALEKVLSLYWKKQDNPWEGFENIPPGF